MTAVRKPARTEETHDSLLLIAQKLDTLDQRQRLDSLELRNTLTNHDRRFDALETMLAKLLEGQAVLLQNDMELKRRLDRKE